MSHLNDHRSTTSLLERYIGTPYDDIKKLLDNLPALLLLLEYFQTAGLVDAVFTYNQTTPADTWVVVHNLGKFPSIETVNSGLEEIEGEVTHISNNELHIEFNSPISGFAYVN